MENRELQQLASVAIEQDDYPLAIGYLIEIVTENPEWEHGQACYDIAVCYEETGNLKEAGEYYKKALSIEPANYHYLGGYASFLFQFGDSSEAYDRYLDLYSMEEKSGDKKGRDETIVGLYELGKRIGLMKSEVDDSINERLSGSGSK
ncbi:MAG: tetratricopeptide repeat protein [Pyrinomonadaceae bacterium]